MSMHLEGPWLSTTGKRKGRRKFRNAEEARRARELESSWDELQRKWGADTAQKRRQPTVAVALPTVAAPARRDTGPRIPSLTGGVDTSAAARAPDKVYTGTEMIGIGTMHKSNSVPVFSEDAAVDIARMRRN